MPQPPPMDANVELASLPFDALIGSPLVAVVRAQAASAHSSLEFLNDCIDPQTRQVRTVDFAYVKTVEQNGRPVEQRHTLTVPLLTLVQVPFLRVEEVNVNFNVKLSSHQWDKSTSDHTVGASVSGGFGIGAFGVKLEGSYSYNKKTDRGTEVNREHSMTVWVKATQDQLPAGMDRILSILDSCIKEKAEAAPPPTQAQTQGEVAQPSISQKRIPPTVSAGKVEPPAAAEKVNG